MIAASGTLLPSSASSFAMGATAAALIGFGMGGEADVTPYLLLRYFGLRSFATLYGLTWTAYACAGAIGPIVMGKAFDVTGSYASLLVVLAASTLAASLLMLFVPPYDSRRAAASADSSASSVSRPEPLTITSPETASPVEGHVNITTRV